jgi:PPOX class probable F420-dependent enzyme
MTDSDRHFYDLLAAQRFGVLATVKKDGRPQLSTVMHHYDSTNRTLLISLTDDRAKTKNLRRDPRASYHVSTNDGWGYVVAEGDAELSAVARQPHDAVVDELVDVYQKIQSANAGSDGYQADADEYRDAMVAERRLVLRLHINRVYGALRP